MKSNQKMALLFYPKKTKVSKKTGTVPVFCRITIDGNQEEVSTGLKILPENWDSENKCFSGLDPNAKSCNSQLHNIEEGLLAHFKVLSNTHERISSLMVKNAYQGRPANLRKNELLPEPAHDRTMLQATQDFLLVFEKMVEKELRSGDTLKQWKCSRKKIEAFIQHKYKAKDISLSDIDRSFAAKYFSYLTLDRTTPLSRPTAKKQVNNAKEILTHAVDIGWIPVNPIADWTVSAPDPDVDPLEFAQVLAILNRDLHLQRLQEVRDVFIFQCFTGFAYQDIYKLSKDNIIQVGLAGDLWLIKDRGKTKVSETVPILPIVQKLIEKYESHPYCQETGRLMPVNSNQKFNSYLKEIAVLAGINRNLTTHLARHTFADIMLNICNLALEDVSKMLGHKSLATTQRYCRVRPIRLSVNMEKAKKILFTNSGNLRLPAA